MIKVYNGDAYAVQADEYDRNTCLQFFLSGHKDEYILIYRGGRPVKVLSYYDVLYRREVPEKVLHMSTEVFAEARRLFFSYPTADERWNRAVAVCGAPDNNGNLGDVECILYYQQNLTNFNYTVSEFEDYAYNDALDLELLTRADIYVFEEYEEYTAFICNVLEREFPQQEKIFLDENADVFSALGYRYRIDPKYGLQDDTESMMYPERGNVKKRVVYITSEREKDFFGGRIQEDINVLPDSEPIAPAKACIMGHPDRDALRYSSLDIMTALFWRNEEKYYGSLNPDKKFMLIRFPLYSSGLGDVIRFCMTKAAAAEYRKLDYIPVIDLSVPDDGNSFSGGRVENVWEDFFEPLNEYRAEEVMQSQHVLLCNDKMDAFNPYMMEQYHNNEHMRAIYKKYLRLNHEMTSYIEPIKDRFFKTDGEKMLGVVARGTDYRYGGFDVPQSMADAAYIDLVREKMAEWNCSFLLLATEDVDILEQFKEAGFGDRLRYLEQERFRYADVNIKGLVIAKMKKENNDYHDEMPYLAVLYLLAGCNSLISNCRCGAFEVADFINGGAYEHRYCCGEGDVM